MKVIRNLKDEQVLGIKLDVKNVIDSRVDTRQDERKDFYLLVVEKENVYEGHDCTAYGYSSISSYVHKN